MEHPVHQARDVVHALSQGTPHDQHNAVYRYFLPGASFEHPFCRVPSFKNVHVPGVGVFDSRALILAVLKWYRILSPKIELKVESCVFDQRADLLYIKISQIFSIWFIPFHRAPVSSVTVLHLVPYPVDGDAGAAPPHGHPLDAAHEKLHAVQEGAEPSYAAVAAGEAAATPAPKHDEGPPEDKQPKKQQQQQQQKGAKKSGKASPAPAPAPAPTTAEASTSTSAPLSPAAATSRPARYFIKKQEDLYQVNEFVKLVAMAPGAGVCWFLQLLATLVCAVGVVILAPVMAVVWPAGRGKEKAA